MKQYIIPLLFWGLIAVSCDKPVSTAITEDIQLVAVSVSASTQASSIYKITISGPGMKTIEPQEYAGGQTIQLFVPEGSSRKFYFERYNSSRQLTDTGSTVSDIGTGINTVRVTMSKTAPVDSCTVTYNGNGNTGGKVPAAQIQVKDGVVTLDNNTGGLVKTGFAFKGWNTESDGSGKDYPAGANYTTDANLTLYAKWIQLLTYTVTYNGNGNTSGKVPADQTKIEGQVLKLAVNIDTLAKTGSHFVGWNIRDDGSGTDYAEGADFTSDTSLTLYARWTQLQTYKVIYSGNDSTGGTVPAIQTKIKGIDLILASNTGNLIKARYSFKGWNTQADGNGKDYDPGAKYTSDIDIILYAKWIALPAFTITYDGNGHSKGTVPGPQSKVSDETLVLADNTGNLEKTGYTFDGWCTSADSTGKVYAKGANYSDNANLLLYAKWKPLTYTVTFNGNKNSKGTVPSSQIKNYGQPLVLADNTGNLEKTDYIFDGWSTSADEVGINYPKGASYTDNADITLYAKWKQRPYTVSFNGNMNTSGEVPASQLKEFGKPLILTDNTGNLEKTDYIFEGWSTSADGAGTDYPVGATYTDDADVVLYAKWKHIPNTVTYNGNKNTSGDVPAPQIKEYGAALILDDNTGNLQRTGYVFDGWSTSADGVGTDYPKGTYYTDNADVILYARWKLQTFTVTYNGNNNVRGTIPGTQTKVYGEALNLAYNNGNLSRTGFAFDGWNTSASGNGTDYVQGASYTTDADLILFSKWLPLGTYTVKYDGNGNESGTVPDSQTITTDVPVVIETNSGSLAKTGYSFEGWNSSPLGTGSDYTAGVSYTAGVNITLYAKWVAIP
ncbi:MAG TPA: InlB B-repeat-containing protein [Chitinispirillaceae bacterium]|nr:InlB B-repeat-containing protein [Chitinispirillaceae bacterium]